MSEDEFTRLFKYMQKEFALVRADSENVRQQVMRVYDSVDGLAKRTETDDQERAAIIGQLDRQESWIKRAASKLHVKYDGA